MIVIYVAVTTKSDTAAEFERVISEIQRDVRTMAGCVKQEWYRDAEIPQRYLVYGEFDSQENFDSYLSSNVVKRIGTDVMPLLEGPPEFRHYSATLLEGN